jgi:transcription initiation factor TFIID subunit 5
MWDIHTGTCVRIFTGHTGSVTAVSLCSDGKTMASASDDHVIRLWDLSSGNLIKSMHGHEGTINSLDFSKNGTLLASGSDDDTVRLWDVKSAEESAISVTGKPSSRKDQSLKVLPTKRTPLYAVSFTNRNILVALGVYKPIK